MPRRHIDIHGSDSGIAEHIALESFAFHGQPGDGTRWSEKPAHRSAPARFSTSADKRLGMAVSLRPVALRLVAGRDRRRGFHLLRGVKRGLRARCLALDQTGRTRGVQEAPGLAISADPWCRHVPLRRARPLISRSESRGADRQFFFAAVNNRTASPVSTHVGRIRHRRQSMGMSSDNQIPATPGINRRGLLKCMAWAGTGVLWTVSGGVPRRSAWSARPAPPRRPGG